METVQNMREKMSMEDLEEKGGEYYKGRARGKKQILCHCGKDKQRCILLGWQQRLIVWVFILPERKVAMQL